MLIIVGTSYAAFDFSFTGEENEISTSDISLKLLESNNEIINVENMLPMSDNEGIEQTGTGNVFDFAVETKASSNVNIGYKINIEKLSLDTGYTSFTDDEIKVYLTDTNDNKILGPVKISELNNYNLYEDMNIHNKDDKVQTDKYRIRVWVDKDVDATDWDENTKLGYKFKIGVSSLEEQGKYNISYSPNGGEGVMATSVYNENTQERLRENTFTRGGYTFKGWSRNTSGEVEYQDKGLATNLTTSSSDKNKTLYALWKPHNYTVKYNANGGFIAEDVAFDVNYVPEGGSNNNKWKVVNGVYESTDLSDVVITEDMAYSRIAATTDDIFSSYLYKDLSITKESELSFEWNVTLGFLSLYIADIDDNYSDVYYDSISTCNGESNNFEEKKVTLPAGNYEIVFEYWHTPYCENFYTNKEQSTLNVFKLAGENLDEKGYVKNIKLISDGEAMNNSNFTVGQNNKLSKNLYLKTGHTFKGWHTNKSETTAKYQDEASLGNLEKTVKENEEINLYAIWEINKYNVNVVVQNGMVDTPTKQIPYNTNGTFNLTPTSSNLIGLVTCTNYQTGIVENNILTVSNVTSDTTCTVKFVDTITTLYEDGTLIINENGASARSSNIAKHGNIIKEYEAMSNSNSYALTSYEEQPWYDEKEQITSVEIGQEISPVKTAYWFYNLANMKRGDFDNLDTSSVTDMSYMFCQAGYRATTWDIGNLSNWDTSSVIDMSYMFSSAGNRATTFSLDLSGWDTSSVTDMSYMFLYAGGSTTTFTLDLSNWDTSSVRYMYEMFNQAGRNATTWSIGDLSNWDTSSVTDMSYMFYYAGNRATTWSIIGDLSNWDTSNVTNMQSMFSSAGSNSTKFELIGLNSWNTSSVTDMGAMFNAAGYSATTFSLDLSGWDTSSVTDMSYMFWNAGNRATTWSIGELSNWDTSSVTDMDSMFWYAGNRATTLNLDLSNWDTSNVTDMTGMFNSVGYYATIWSVTIPSTTGSLINTTSKLYGSSSSVYADPPSGKSFTLAS